jgi:Na+/phosphate symporter
MCGGAAPASRRRELFAQVTEAEIDRLHGLTADISSVREAIRLLGKPDEDLHDGLRVRTKATRRAPSRVRTYRLLRFKQLSDTADVELVDYRTDGIRFTFQGKIRRPAPACRADNDVT